VSDVSGKAFDGMVAKVQHVTRPVMVPLYRKFAERARLFEEERRSIQISKTSMKALIARPTGPAAGILKSMGRL
jgi:hypothetical protein